MVDLHALIILKALAVFVAGTYCTRLESRVVQIYHERV